MGQLHNQRLTEQSQIRDLKGKIRTLHLGQMDIQNKDNRIAQLERNLNILAFKNQDSNATIDEMAKKEAKLKRSLKDQSKYNK